MKIAVVNEVSACSKNADIVKALEGFDNEVINVGMTNPEQTNQLTYIETGLLSALLLNSKKVDFVIGGCGTGQGYMNSALQYPNVFCGLVESPLDAWLFAQINGGNCISLALNKGYGWAGDNNLQFIFERLFSVEIGCGFPEHRKESQQASRKTLEQISKNTHLPFYQIIERTDRELIKNVLTFPGVWKVLDVDNMEDEKLVDALMKRYEE